jgi:hypothetical protein
MNYKLFEFFTQLEDPRRGQGQRHKLADILTIVIMAILSGHQGLKGFARFAASNEQDLTEVLQLKHGVPCFFTIRSVLQGLDEQLLAKQFISWVKNYHSELRDEFVALDGKAIKSTVNGGNTGLQNFISVVNAFGHQSGIVYGMKSFENASSDESSTVRSLLAQLGLKDSVFTMDALHAQKNT